MMKSKKSEKLISKNKINIEKVGSINNSRMPNQNTGS